MHTTMEDSEIEKRLAIQRMIEKRFGVKQERAKPEKEKVEKEKLKTNKNYNHGTNSIRMDSLHKQENFGERKRIKP